MFCGGRAAIFVAKAGENMAKCGYEGLVKGDFAYRQTFCGLMTVKSTRKSDSTSGERLFAGSSIEIKD